MYSIVEILKANENYEKEREKLNQLSNKVREINDNLDLDEVEKTLDYAKTKELYSLILSRSNDKERCKSLKEIMDNKKALEYPQINDVHYYSSIKNIDFLNKEEKIALDILIKEAYNNRRVVKKLENLDSKVLNFLIENSILEKMYIFHCTCDSDECYDKEISQETFDKLKVYWEKEMNGEETTAEEDREMNYGCFETGCWNDGTVEVCSLKDFDEHLRRIEYKVKMKPDMTLDKI